jgi:two-component system LytT family response regulator
VLIVDDEPLARERISEMLRGDQEVEIVGCCASGREVPEAVRQCAPDLIFLDVQMPEMDGFEALEALGSERIPLIIFVTAYDQFAVRAFDVLALDYLLKPFDRERFGKALRRAKDRIRRDRSDGMTEQILALLSQIKGKPKYLERLVVKAGGRIFFLKAEEIDWIGAEGNYVSLHVGKHSHLLRETISSLETQLDPDMFRRIHRSTIVNIERIKELHPLIHGEYQVVLHNGVELTLSRGYRDRLQEFLGKAL